MKNTQQNGKVPAAEEGQKQLRSSGANASMAKLHLFQNIKPYVKQPVRKLLNCSA